MIDDLYPRGLQSQSEKDCVLRCWEALTGLPKEKLTKMLGLYPGMTQEEVSTSWEVATSRDLWVNPDWKMVIVLMVGSPISGHAILKSRDYNVFENGELYWDPFYGYIHQLPDGYLEIQDLMKGHCSYMGGRDNRQALRWLCRQSKFSCVNLKEVKVKKGKLTVAGDDLLTYIAENLPLNKS